MSGLINKIKTYGAKKITLSIIKYIIVFIFILWILIPVAWIVALSFKPYAEWRVSYLIPKNPTLSNYVMLFAPKQLQIFIAYTAVIEPITKPLLNSVIVSFIATLIATTIGFFTAYGASRYNTPGPFMIFFTLLTRMLPPATFVTPLVVYYTTLQLLDNLIGLILLYAAASVTYAIWIIKGYIDAIPREWEEAALLEGAKPLEVLRKVILPIARPGIVVSGLFIFLLCWTELLFALVLTHIHAVTLPVQISKYVTGVGPLYGAQAAAALLGSLPPVIIGYLIQRHLITGFTFGLVRG
ncbi:MAG: carbohydrate ABC transporter permease [Thermoprotei archaeon]